MSERIRVVVADDHPLFLDGVVHALGATGAIAVVGQASNAADAVRLARDCMPDLVLLDIAMPGSGLQAARAIADVCPATRIVILTVSEDEDDLMAALKAGASGYVLKGASSRELLASIRAVHDGEVFVPPQLAGHLLREMMKPRPASPVDELTARERSVLELLAAGLSNQEIGLRLSLTEKTVKHYMTNILAKLHVRSRLEAALLAHRAGIAPEI